MNYFTFFAVVLATVKRVDSVEEGVPDSKLEDAVAPVPEEIQRAVEEFRSKPVTPLAVFELEGRLKALSCELSRLIMEWVLNHLEPRQASDMPTHAEFDGQLYTRVNRRTPHNIATTFGEICLMRVGYRPTDKTGGPMIFPLEQHLGIMAGATPALAERVAYYQAEAGATQRRTLERLKREHHLDLGIKRLRQVVDRVAKAMLVERHEVQAEKLLQMLAQAFASKGKHKPALSVGRDGISFGAPVKGGTVFEVASAATITVYDRRGQRLGTVYLAYTPESKQGTMSENLTRLLKDVLQRWEKPLPRLCYVTDAGDNESAYYNKVLRPMRHPRTCERLEWVRVLDYYHASERVWKMAEALFGKDPAAKTWARKMLKLLKEPNGIRRVLNSASVLRARYPMKKTREKEFHKAYNYLRKRTKFMRYSEYKKVGIPMGSGVTEAACKTIYTQRLKLSGMRWKTAGAQTILNLRVMLLSGVWTEAYQRLLKKSLSVTVPSYAMPSPKTLKIAA